MSHQHYNIYPRYRILDKYCRFTLMLGGTFTSERECCSARAQEKEFGPAMSAQRHDRPRPLIAPGRRFVALDEPAPAPSRRVKAMTETQAGVRSTRWI